MSKLKNVKHDFQNSLSFLVNNDCILLNKKEEGIKDEDLKNLEILVPQKEGGTTLIKLGKLDSKKSSGTWLTSDKSDGQNDFYMTPQNGDIATTIIRLKKYIDGDIFDVVPDNPISKVAGRPARILVKTVPNPEMLSFDCSFYTKDHMDLGRNVILIHGIVRGFVSGEVPLCYDFDGTMSFSLKKGGAFDWSQLISDVMLVIHEYFEGKVEFRFENNLFNRFKSTLDMDNDFTIPQLEVMKEETVKANDTLAYVSFKDGIKISMPVGYAELSTARKLLLTKSREISLNHLHGIGFWRSIGLVFKSFEMSCHVPVDLDHEDMNEHNKFEHAIAAIAQDHSEQVVAEEQDEDYDGLFDEVENESVQMNDVDEDELSEENTSVLEAVSEEE